MPQTMEMIFDQLKLGLSIFSVFFILMFIVRTIESVKRLTLMREMKKYYVRENKKAAQAELLAKRGKIENQE